MKESAFAGFMGDAICVFARASARLARIPEYRAANEKLSLEQLHEGFLALAKESLALAIPKEGLSAEQTAYAEDQLSKIGANVAALAFASPPEEWVLVCAGCFGCFGAEIIVGNAATFKPPAGWRCDECGGGKMEVGIA